MTKQAVAFEFAQRFDSKPVYTTKEAIIMAGSKDNAYDYLKLLENLGVAEHVRGYFTLNNILVSQSAKIIDLALPSLKALSKGRRFGLHYNESDIGFAKKNIHHRLITLDYKAWELTKFQYPRDIYIYVEDIEQTACYLKKNRFREGKKGRIVLLPVIGNITDEKQRVYFDCLAKGGRSINDAIAIELSYPGQLNHTANFPVQLMQKVEEDLPR
jgi:hypothetical protein